MFVLHADKNSLTARQREPVTSGSVNVYEARFEFSEDWAGLTRTAVFKAGTVSRCVLLDDSNTCVVPWEVLEHYHPFTRLMAGVYGTRDGDVVLPTVWASLGVILEGAAPDGEMWPPTPELWEQALERKQDKLTGLPGQVVGFDEAGNAVPQDAAPGGGGEGGTTDHRALSHRDAAGQHPIGAIEGLKEALERIPRPMTADELRKILMNGDAANV